MDSVQKTDENYASFIDVEKHEIVDLFGTFLIESRLAVDPAVFMVGPFMLDAAVEK
jgi:hypothetical protein